MQSVQKKSSIDDKTRLIARWVLGIIFIIGGMSLLKDGAFVSVLLITLSGVAVLPPVVEKLNELLKGQFGFTAQLGTVLGLFMLGAILSPSSLEEQTLTADEVQQIVEEALEEQAKMFAEENTTAPVEIQSTDAVQEVEPVKVMTSEEIEISKKQDRIDELEGYIETFDAPFDEYRRINDMWLALGNFNLNKDQFFIDIWQEEINKLQNEINNLKN